MLSSELLKECMERRKLSLSLMSTITEIKEPKLQQYLDGVIPTDNDMDKICKYLNIDENDATDSNLNISVNECANKMGEGVLFVRSAIEKGKLPGICVETKGRKKFHIPRKAFVQYMEQWKVDMALQAEVLLLKSEIKGLTNEVQALGRTVNSLTGIMTKMSTALKNAPIPEQDRAQDSIS